LVIAAFFFGHCIIFFSMLSLLLHHHCTIIAPFSYHYIFSLASVPSSLESAANDSTISRSFLAHFPIIFVTFFSPMPSIMFYHLPHPAQQQRRTLILCHCE
jgi:hypothetical protein